MTPALRPALLITFAFVISAEGLAQDAPRCPVDPARTAVLPFEGTLLPGTEVRPAAAPTQDDIQAAECLLADRVAQWNAFESYSKDLTIHDTRDYYRQYCALQNAAGHRLLYLNAFCGTWHLSRWKAQWIMVEDGGTCYFQSLIDLTSRKVLMFSVNGVG